MTREAIAAHFLAGLRARYTRAGGWVFTPGNGLTMERYADEVLAAYLAWLRRDRSGDDRAGTDGD